MERSGRIILVIFATLSTGHRSRLMKGFPRFLLNFIKKIKKLPYEKPTPMAERCGYETDCYTSCCDGYCCPDSNSSDSMGTGTIVLLIAALVAVKIMFCVFLCYIRRNRRQTVIRSLVVRGPREGANTTVVNTSHVMSPVNPNHAGYNQLDQQQQWFKPMPHAHPQAMPSNAEAPPPYSSVQQQGGNQKIIPV